MAVRPIRENLKAQVAALPKMKRDSERAEKSSRVRQEPNFTGWYWSSFVDSGQLLCATHKKTPTRVTPGTYERALAILNALCFQAETRGYSAIFDEEAGRIVLEGFEGKMYLRIGERFEDAWRSEKSNWEKSPRNVKYKVSTGELRLHVSDRGWSETCFSDTPDLPLEGKLNAVFLKIYASTVRCREHAREAEARRQMWLEEERQRDKREQQRQEIAAAKEAERRKREALFEEALAWQRAKLLREYLAYLEQLPPQEAGERDIEWRGWARRVAEEVDPVGKLVDH